jgi:serine/threonine protein phosphatase PrpC
MTLRMEYAARTHRGRVRKRNEDSFYIPDGKGLDGLAVVADGMGGYNAGDVASALGVQVACNIIAAARALSPAPTAEYSVRWAFNEANRAILEYAGTNEFYQGMGTTMTMACFEDGRWVVGNVGDSRAYLVRDGAVSQITTDHSLVQLMVERGRMTPEEARKHPYRNVITRSIGTESFSGADIFIVDAQPEDVLILCSDGLSNYLPNADMLELLATGAKLDGAAEAMVELSLARGGSDNITVAMVRMIGGDA